MLINSTYDILSNILSGHDILANHLGITIPEHWTEFGNAPFEYTKEKIKDDPDQSVWWSWLPVLVSENTLVGNCGYKGPPENGLVEIGYEVSSAYRLRGYATEMAMALIKNAFTFEEVDLILAHTLANENPSVQVLRKCGFQFAGLHEDPEEGIIWRWKLSR